MSTHKERNKTPSAAADKPAQVIKSVWRRIKKPSAATIAKIKAASVKLAGLVLILAAFTGCGSTGDYYTPAAPAVYSAPLAPADAAGLAAGFNTVRAIQATEAAAAQQAQQTQAIQSVGNAIYSLGY
jgi:hypothetical protein